ncbi:phage tail tape measure protein [Rhodococcus sp. NPDC127528]|uniref:phage tail tape measure protein n=1 Tax=unclassified Rhodococcus (in: high G+C Gram-positive bacteria) TaxID=192944 RepID=UPI00362BDDC8
MPGGRIDIEVSPDLKAFPGKLQSGLQGTVGMAGKLGAAMGLAFGAGGVALAAKSIIKLGNDFTNELNTMQAVSSATAEQMAAVSARAKELGNDQSLANTSASDAAAAMTELAKGGFSVEESMSAAKGTLQLAAAAQIDAASAATVQSQALQAFGLNASEAARTADTLANAANASSAEIGDIAQGLQQSGAVAHQFGLSLQDTSAVLGMFANAGITGSDAGTLLKSALLALTDQGKPAQAAIRELGLTVYDAQGKFVGMHELFKQLKDASANMTDEQYQAATATLFGSDAMRLAGVAAEQGAEGYDKMRGAIDRQGAAADVAAAKTQGLPGALAAVENNVETLALGLYDLAKGPLENAADGFANFVEDATPKVVGGLSVMGGAAAEAGSFFLDLPAPVQAATAALVALRVTGLGDKLSEQTGRATSMFKGLGDAVRAQQVLARQSTQSYDQFGVAIEGSGKSIGTTTAALAVLEQRVPVIGAMGEAYRTAGSRLSDFSARHRTASTDLQTLALRTRDAASSADILTRSIGHGAVAGVADLGRAAAGVGAAGVKGLTTAAGGLVSALGGPWGVAIMGATTAIGFLADSHAKAEQKARDQEAAEKALGDTLDEQTGKVTAATRKKLAEEAESSGDLARMESYRLDTRDYVNAQTGDQPAYQRIASVAREHASAGLDSQRTFSADAYKAAGISREELVSGLLREGQSWDTLNEKITRYNDVQKGLAATGQKFGAALTPLQDLIDGMQPYDESAITMTQNINATRISLDRQARATMDANKALGQSIPITESLKAKFAEYGATVESVPDEKTVMVRGLTEEAQKKLRDLNFSVEKMEDGSFKVVARDDEAKASLADMIGRLNMLSNTKAIANVALDKTVFEMNAQQTRDLIRILDQEEAAPEVRLILDKLREGKQLTLKDLQTISEKTADPKVIAHVADALRDINAVDVAADNATRPRTINIDVAATAAAQRAFNATGQEGPIAPVLRGNADGGRLPAFAGGGRMPGSGPGTERTDGIYAVTREGRGIAMVDGREWVVNSEMSDKYDRELAAINAGTFPKLPGYATGGRIGSASQDAHQFLAGESGKKYQYAGVGNPSWDCSAYSSAAYAILTGRDPHTRWYTTESDFLSLGFVQGLGPRSALNLGVHNGGGGQYSHMASALGGIPFESGANGVRYGSGAASPTDPQFENHWHLPASRFSPPEDDSNSATAYGRPARKKATWEEKDELQLNSAKIAVQQAIEARDRTNGNEKKTPADRDQAANKVARAEQRVKDLEAKKSAAESGADAGPAPAAPGLESSLTDDELRLRDLQRAINKADADRNEVYDDLERIGERDDADDALQRAINALAAEQKRQAEELKKSSTLGTSAAGGGGTQSLSQMLGDVASEFVTSNVSDLFSVLGVNDSAVGRLAGLGVGIAQWSQDPRGEKSGVGPAQAPTFSTAEIETQAPAVPGTPEWATAMANAMSFPNLFKNLKDIPTVIRDTGGPLPHGVAGLNLSGETEWVLNGAQRRQYEVDRRDLAALRAGRGGNGGLSRADLAHLAQTVTEAIGRPIAVNNYAPGGDGVERTLVKVEQRRVQRVRLGAR